VALSTQQSFDDPVPPAPAPVDDDATAELAVLAAVLSEPPAPPLAKSWPSLFAEPVRSLAVEPSEEPQPSDETRAIVSRAEANRRCIMRRAPSTHHATPGHMAARQAIRRIYELLSQAHAAKARLPSLRKRAQLAPM
jgi:hypothetical protein